jgi:polyhydroxyalkanoate synthesis regulator phasin
MVSAVINRKKNRRIKQSEVVQHEAVVRKEDASVATEMMGLLERTVAHMERMNDYNKTNAVSLL